jgi:hypothetical protein
MVLYTSENIQEFRGSDTAYLLPHGISKGIPYKNLDSAATR